MKITVKKFTHPDEKYVGLFIHFDRETALKLMQSLLGQINTNNPNTDRLEFMSGFSKETNIKGLRYLSICVDPE